MISVTFYLAVTMVHVSGNVKIFATIFLFRSLCSGECPENLGYLAVAESDKRCTTKTMSCPRDEVPWYIEGCGCGCKPRMFSLVDNIHSTNGVIAFIFSVSFSIYISLNNTECVPMWGTIMSNVNDVCTDPDLHIECPLGYHRWSITDCGCGCALSPASTVASAYNAVSAAYSSSYSSSYREVPVSAACVPKGGGLAASDDQMCAELVFACDEGETEWHIPSCGCGCVPNKTPIDVIASTEPDDKQQDEKDEGDNAGDDASSADTKSDAVQGPNVLDLTDRYRGEEQQVRQQIGTITFDAN